MLYLETLFIGLIRRPRISLFTALIIIVLSAAGLHKLVKNTSVDAFIPDEHHSLQAREQIKQTFGLQDPIIFSVLNQNGSIFEPDILNLIRKIHFQLKATHNVLSVKSLVSESYISGTDEELTVFPLLADPVQSTQQAEQLEKMADSMDAFSGTLISWDKKASLLVIELSDPQFADQSYLDIQALADSYKIDNVSLHVAGQGAISGYLSKYIAKDSRKMQPFMIATLLLILFLAFRQGKGLVGPTLILFGASLGAIGIMAWCNVPYYAITGALPIVITSIAVADSIHLLTAYYELRTARPDDAVPELVEIAMRDMVKPVTLTTLTTIAGFLGLYWASMMPPIKYFGLFAAVGVLLAWLFTLLLLPAVLVLLSPRSSKVFSFKQGKVKNIIGDALGNIAASSAKHPKTSSLMLLAILCISCLAALQVRVDRSQIENFKDDEPIRLAHQHINHQYAGSAYLDIMISARQVDGLLQPEALNQVKELQDYLESLPHVRKSLSIVDYLGKLHQVLADPNAQARTLPAESATIAQYLLIYESSSDIRDFADEIDNQYQNLLVRAYLDTEYSSEESHIVQFTEKYLSWHFNGGELDWTLGGRVNVRYHWMKRLAESHFLSIGISLLLVTIIAAWLFKSLTIGVIAAVPVLFTILVMYGVMGTIGIMIEPATSMFAAIAIGVGIDFPIHLLERLQTAQKQDQDMYQAIREKFPGACRACFFNAAALACGFATLFFSELPTLHRFGLMIMLACLVSFLAALIWVPLAWQWQLRKNSEPVKAYSNSALTSDQ
jgi:uncharacterized protein